MADATITLYTTEPCRYCTSAKTLLQNRGVAYEEINLARDPDGRGALLERTGQMTFPQVIVGDRSIGGFRELLAADRAGTLAALLAPAA
jgi:glutaredoxin 3